MVILISSAYPCSTVHHRSRLVTSGGGWDWRFPGCMCEGLLGGMCAGVVCEVILFCTRSVLLETMAVVSVV